ncbi:D-2-hydroxyacid dehydrogenase [Limosilactobacillus sp.]|uniref:D-2-hydroxyacid dehydrogenase n=1 Tax=Limosilactobacillus sp. TaxID=2773925 RepID=UPI0025C690EC|nr:D-2-hydroxyacid dehydrogenase [Limosilactobacillus sp.]MCH3921387.1 D-2-hydroxyacid dehydrogenase [Limosilactobacillus sp.]MCH3928158.1 D-2-hydroxyacid dehydrogenase [Limosilactobacillus sp.]
MKIIMFGTKTAERPYAKEWAEMTGNEVKLVSENLTPETLDMVKGFDGVSIQETSLLGDADFYRQLAELGIKQISTRTAGYDMLDLKACQANGITVTNVAVYSPRAIAEMGLTQAMYLLRRIGEYESREKQGDFRWNPELISNEIYNLTVGVIGLGNIGGATAQLYKALGARVLAYDPNKNVEYAPFVEFTDMSTIIRTADIITLHTPLLPSTKNMLAAPQFASMKKGAIVINMARGGLINTADLLDALKSKHLGGAGLDTLADEFSFFNQEVPFDQTPADYQELAKMPNVLVTPHVAFFTKTSIRNMVHISLDDVVKVVNGEHSRNEVRI